MYCLAVQAGFYSNAVVLNFYLSFFIIPESPSLQHSITDSNFYYSLLYKVFHWMITTDLKSEILTAWPSGHFYFSQNRELHVFNCHFHLLE